MDANSRKCNVSAYSNAPEKGQPSSSPDNLQYLVDSIEAEINAPEFNSERQLPLVLATLKGNVRICAMDRHGCRVLQHVLELATDKQQTEIACELHGHVCEAIESQHANHVLQKCVEMMRPPATAFILSELTANKSPSTIAQHEFGCRVLQRVIEHFSPKQLETCLGEVLNNSAYLCKHKYGNFVMQHILEHGNQGQRGVIIVALKQNLLNLQQPRVDQHTCNVLDKALTYGPIEDQRELAGAILTKEGLLACIAKHSSGLAAMQRLCVVADQEMILDAKRQLRASAQEIKGIRKALSVVSCKMEHVGMKHTPYLVQYPSVE